MTATTNGIDSSVPSPARVYDYLLGGKDNYEVDRRLADRLLAVAPDAAFVARQNRAFLVRSVELIAAAGVRQFVDLGTGVPTSPSVHEVARRVDPAARVVYVDNDPIVKVHNDARLATVDGVVSVRADVRRPEEILAAPELQATIDFTQPVAVLFLAVLHFVNDADRPAEIIARFRERMVPGSYLVISHTGADSDPRANAALSSGAGTPTESTHRTPEEILRFFDGFALLEPGLTRVERWRNEEPTEPTRFVVHAGVGRLD